MTLATVITAADFDNLVNSAFAPETPLVAAAESDLGQPLEWFVTPDDIRTKAAQCIAEGIRNYGFMLWYPSMKGHYSERKVILNPPRDGHSLRYSLSGWGLIRLQLYVTPPDTLQCRITVNTEGRAQLRERRYPDLGAVSDWDWRIVETYGFRLSRQLAAMGRTMPVVQP